MPESPQQWYARVAAAIQTDGYRESDLQQWSSWPWTGELHTKALEAPVDSEPERRGIGGGAEDCQACWNVDNLDSVEPLAWHDDLFYLIWAPESSLPFAAFLMSNRHADLQDLTAAEAARMGEILVGVEQAACSALDVPRIQAARWGDGGEHLHWWLYARPTGMLQLRGTFLSHWDDLLPVKPPAVARADARAWAAQLQARIGGHAVTA